MRYRVTFRKRFNQDGQGSDEPVTLLNLPDGVIQDSAFVETFEPDSLHVEERMEEDDDFFPFGTEVWEFEVIEGRERDFEDAVKESGAAIEFDKIPEQVGSEPAS
jgi:hypothetical protein